MPEKLSLEKINGVLEDIYSEEKVEILERSFGAVNSTYIFGVEEKKNGF